MTDPARYPSTPLDNTPPPSTAEAILTPARQKQLFSALDLSSGQLKPVREAAAMGDYEAADHAWAQYLRARALPWKFDYLHPKRIPGFKNLEAENALKGKVLGGGVLIYYTAPSQNFNWFFDATKIVPPPNNEWQWQLCRMSFWDAMARAYRATGDERYPQAWSKQLCSFFFSCPVPSSAANKSRSAWRTIEAGIRMSNSWPNSYFSFLHSPSVSNAELSLYTLSCLEHARYLRQFQTTGNWVTMEMSGLYTTGCIFPEFDEAGDWRSFAIGKLSAQEREQILPDGAQYELSTGYHNVTLDYLAGVAETAIRMGRRNELPSNYIAKLETAFAFDLYLMSPDRGLPRYNDSWPVEVKGIMQRALQYFPNRTDFRWVATDGESGSPPTTTSHYFPWAGFAAMRSGWERDANYASFRLGPLGYGHCQQTKLDFVVWAYGREVLYASGGGSYETSKWRRYSADTYSHNCVIVDGKAQRRQTKDRMDNVSKVPIEARWQSTPAYDFVAGVYDQGYGTETGRIAAQVRRVLFVKPDLFVVADTLTPHDTAEHSYEARWQLKTILTHEDLVTHAVTTTAPDQPNLAVVPLSTANLQVRDVCGQEQPELLGWDVRKDMVPEYAPATTVVHAKKGKGVQQFLTLFIPIKPGTPNPVKSVSSLTETSAVVTFNDGRVLLVSAQPQPDGNLAVIEKLPGGQKGRVVVTK
jgi:hypothetical protein